MWNRIADLKLSCSWSPINPQTTPEYVNNQKQTIKAFCELTSPEKAAMLWPMLSTTGIPTSNRTQNSNNMDCSKRLPNETSHLVQLTPYDQIIKFHACKTCRIGRGWPWLIRSNTHDTKEQTWDSLGYYKEYIPTPSSLTPLAWPVIGLCKVKAKIINNVDSQVCSTLNHISVLCFQIWDNSILCTNFKTYRIERKTTEQTK